MSFDQKKMLGYVTEHFAVFFLFIVLILMSLSLPAESDQVGTSTGWSSPNQLKYFFPQFPNQVAGAGHLFTNSPAALAVDPLVDTFANLLSQHFTNDPKTSVVFSLASLPGSQASGLFRDVLFRNFQKNSAASNLADILSKSVASTFDFFKPAQFPYLVGQSMGKFLMKRGLLTPENVSNLANTIASDISNAFQARNAVDNDGFLQTLFDGCASFVRRFGYKTVDHAAELTEYYVSGLGVLAFGIHNQR